MMFRSFGSWGALGAGVAAVLLGACGQGAQLQATTSAGGGGGAGGGGRVEAGSGGDRPTSATAEKLGGSTCVSITRTAANAVADTEIASNPDGAHPNGNFGSGLAAIAGTVGPGVREALFRFDLSRVPAYATVDSATMHLIARAESNGGPGTTLGVFPITSPWAEDTVTWATAPSHAASPIASDQGGPGVHAFDVTPTVAAWLSGGAENDGVLLAQSPPYNTNFHTSEDPIATFHPQLGVCYPTCEMARRAA